MKFLLNKISEILRNLEFSLESIEYIKVVSSLFALVLITKGFSPGVFHRLADDILSGQLVTSEIIMASENGCPIEFHRIDVDKCDPVFDKECQGNKYIPFLRADYDRQTGRSPNSPREQVIRNVFEM